MSFQRAEAIIPAPALPTTLNNFEIVLSDSKSINSTSKYQSMLTAIFDEFSKINLNNVQANSLIARLNTIVSAILETIKKTSPVATPTKEISEILRQANNKINLWWSSYIASDLKTLKSLVQEVQTLGDKAGEKRKTQRKNKLDKFPGDVDPELKDLKLKINEIRNEVASNFILPQDKMNKDSLNKYLKTVETLLQTSTELLKIEKQGIDNLPQMLKQHATSESNLVTNHNLLITGKKPSPGDAADPSQSNIHPNDEKKSASKPFVAPLSNPQSVISTPPMHGLNGDDSPSKINSGSGSDSDSNNDSPSNRSVYSNQAKVPVSQPLFGGNARSALQQKFDPKHEVGSNNKSPAFSN